MCATGPPNDVRPSRSAARNTSRRRILLPRRSRLPQRLVHSGKCVGRTRKDEEQVGEAVEIDGDERIDRVPAGGRERFSLGTATDRPRDVEAGRRCRVPRAARSSSAPAATRCTCRTRSRADRSSPAPHGACLRPRRARRGRHRRRRARSGRVASVARSSSGQSPARTTPSSELSSSVVPKAAIRASSFDTREPSPSEVSPASPPRV